MLHLLYEFAPSNKRLQLTPNSSLQSIRGTVLAAGAVPQRWRSALLGAAEPRIRWAARGMLASDSYDSLERPDDFGGLRTVIADASLPIAAAARSGGVPIRSS